MCCACAQAAAAVTPPLQAAFTARREGLGRLREAVQLVLSRPGGDAAAETALRRLLKPAVLATPPAGKRRRAAELQISDAVSPAGAAEPVGAPELGLDVAAADPGSSRDGERTAAEVGAGPVASGLDAAAEAPALAASSSTASGSAAGAVAIPVTVRSSGSRASSGAGASQYPQHPACGPRSAGHGSQADSGVASMSEYAGLYMGVLCSYVLPSCVGRAVRLVLWGGVAAKVLGLQSARGRW